MTQRRIPFVPEDFYHIYNRGTDKHVLFKDQADHQRFIELLFLSNSIEPINVRDIREATQSVFNFIRGEQLVAIGAYCLIPNHFHILVTPLIENGVQIFMKKVSTGYSMYFNKRYERTGVLFEGRYKSQHVADDRYLKYLFAYIHLNPIKLIQPDWKEVGIVNIAAAKDFLNSYEYSSYKDYFAERESKGILMTEKFPEYFSTKKEIDTEISEWLQFKSMA